jgi:hypothetical protein|tara:strand:+ start:2412 stop:3200 length:789 start_codon:yes stop_codon:yes gene_type:complete
MAFPHTVYGSYGDEKTVSANKIGGLPLGTRMELPDGRVFRHARASATALVAGKLYQGVSRVADTMYEDQLVTGSAAVGATVLTITAGGTTAVATDFYDDGYIYTASSAGSGVGEVYKIKSAASAATGSSCVVTLYSSDGLKTLVAGGTTKTGMSPNEYNEVLLTTANTVRVAPIAGVPTTAVAASNYCWIQRRGPVAAFASGTVMITGVAVAANTNAAGNFGPWFAAASANNLSWVTEQTLGYAMNVAGTAENFSLVNLTLE